MDRKYFIVHGTTTCPFCTRAVGLLESKNISYVFSLLNGSQLVETKQRWGYKTVPMIVERDTHDKNYESFIGGYDDLCSYLKSSTTSGDK